MKPRLPDPSSPIATHIVAFVGHKRARNRRYKIEDKVLRMFDGYLNTAGIMTLAEITPAVLDPFFLSRRRADRGVSTTWSVSLAACSNGWSNTASSTARPLRCDYAGEASRVRLVFWTCEQLSGWSTSPRSFPIGTTRRSAALLIRRFSVFSSALGCALGRLLDCAGETWTVIAIFLSSARQNSPSPDCFPWGRAWPHASTRSWNEDRCRCPARRPTRRYFRS